MPEGAVNDSIRHRAATDIDNIWVKLRYKEIVPEPIKLASGIVEDVRHRPRVHWGCGKRGGDYRCGY